MRQATLVGVNMLMYSLNTNNYNEIEFSIKQNKMCRKRRNIAVSVDDRSANLYSFP